MSQPPKGATKPPLVLEPAYTYAECAEVLGVSLGLIWREAGAGRLRHFREGRNCKVMKADLEAWREGQYQRAIDRRAARVTKRDRKTRPSPARNKSPNTYKAQADADILESLGE